MKVGGSYMEELKLVVVKSFSFVFIAVLLWLLLFYHVED